MGIIAISGTLGSYQKIKLISQSIPVMCSYVY